MISYFTLRVIHLRLCQFKNNNLPFGGVNIIIMGDLLQLKPVMGTCIFEIPNHFKHEFNIWNIFQMHVLTINQRHIGDNSYGELCSRVRIGEQTSNDLKILNNRLLYYLNHKTEFEDSIHLCARKKTVEHYNAINYQRIKKNKNAYKIDAQDTYSNGANAGKKADKKYIYAKEGKTGGIIDSIELTVGCRVMLRRNQDVPIGLVNGAMGTVTGFEWPMLSREQTNPGDPY